MVGGERRGGGDRIGARSKIGGLPESVSTQMVRLQTQMVRLKVASEALLKLARVEHLRSSTKRVS
eukprot:980778-Prorocentrum_minimum.AAC.2